jgi:pSer/pThr/pTyr-binding forkhead associated (FHA) protein
VQGSCIIGRASVVDLCLKHASVSRRHAQLKRSGDRLYVRDLGSQNGTYVNQQRITNEAEVFAGDSIIIGTSLLKIKDSLSSENELATQPYDKPAKSHRAPYYTVLVASLTASLSTLVAMVLLKLIFHSAPPAEAEVEVEIENVSVSLHVVSTPPPDLLVHVPASENLPEDSAPRQKTAVPPVDKASILEAFQQARAEDALLQAQETQQVLLTEQLTAFLSQWQTAENLWKEVSKTKPSSVRPALLAHEKALLAAARISANSSYAETLQNRLSSLKQMAQMASAKPAPSPKVSTRAPTSPVKQAPAASKELQEKRRAIDEAFGGL